MGDQAVQQGRTECLMGVGSESSHDTVPHQGSITPGMRVAPPDLATALPPWRSSTDGRQSGPRRTADVRRIALHPLHELVGDHLAPVPLGWKGYPAVDEGSGHGGVVGGLTRPPLEGASTHWAEGPAGASVLVVDVWDPAQRRKLGGCAEGVASSESSERGSDIHG